MCGILLLLLKDEVEIKEFVGLDELIQLTNDRGPEYQSDFYFVEDKISKTKLASKASVLSFRSEHIEEQPFRTKDSSNFLLFNGQIFSYLNDDQTNQESPAFYNLNDSKRNMSDIEFLFLQLEIAKTSNDVANVISRIQGPYSLVYYRANLSSLFFCRDVFGRRSLCIGRKQNQSQPYVISSVGPKSLCKDLVWSEVEACGIHKIDLKLSNRNAMSGANPFPGFIQTWKWALEDIYPMDNMIRIAHKIPSLKPPFAEALNLNKSSYNFKIEDILLQFKDILIDSVRCRVVNRRTMCLKCRKVSIQNKCNHSSVAIAFSGGIDSTILAVVLDRVLDKSKSIDLLNVAFSSDAPDRESALDAFEELKIICKDRIWNLICCDISKGELTRLRSTHIKHLISPLETVIDDSLGCALWFAARGSGLLLSNSLQKTHAMNESCANVNVELGNENFEKMNTYIKAESKSNHDGFYTTPASILLVGMGIDEQLGGYSSHRRAWQKSQVEGVLNEISRQMHNISIRNLGRDDRICGSFGRDVRLPYLDERLVGFLNKLPFEIKMNLSDRADELGPKKLLRLLGLELGLGRSSWRVKRAMQFGSRIAKLECRSEHGNDICSRLK